jgi:hypothetical protein
VNIKNRNTEESTNGMAGGANDVAHESLNAIRSSVLMAIEQNRVVTQKLARAMRDVSVQFLNARLDHAGRVIERSRDFQGISDLVTLQHDWMMDIARDYAEMTKRFAEVLHELPQNGIAKADNPAPARETANPQRRDGGSDRVAA